jgi:hypothetical protein
MQPNVNVTDTHAAAEIDAIDALLDGLDDIEMVEEAAPIEETIEEPDVTEPEMVAATEDAGLAEDAVVEPETIEPEITAEALLQEMELGSEDLTGLETEIAKTEAYEEQEASGDVNTEPTPAAAEAPKKERKAKAAGTPRVERDLSKLPADAFVLTTDIPADLEANKVAVMGTRPNQKKIAEKFENVLLAVAANRKPSTYVMDCFAILQAKGEVTSGDLVAALKADGYSDGTARSQVGQIMALFPVLKIAERTTRSSLKLNPDSMIAGALKDMLSA